MIEVELKARVAEPGQVEERLRSFAHFVKDFDKADAYWHGPDWRLARGTKGFRIRSEDGKTIVTFKTKRCEGGMEINRERELEVSDRGIFVELIERLGCEPFFEKRKTGRRFEYEAGGTGRPIALELAELQGLGWFLEIEALLPEEDPAAIALAQGEIRGLLARAGLPESTIESRYYSELLIEAGRVSQP